MHFMNLTFLMILSVKRALKLRTAHVSSPKALFLLYS